MPDMSEMVRVRCTCGTSLLAPITAAGKSSKCPKCGEMVTVPMATETDWGVEPEQLNLAMGKGITYCIIAGLIAAGVWAGICALVEGQIGLLMCAIGVACGFGMMMGTQKQQYLDQKVSQANARAKTMGGKASGVGGLGMRATVGFVALLLAFGMWDIISMLFGAALAYGIATFKDLT